MLYVNSRKQQMLEKTSTFELVAPTICVKLLFKCPSQISGPGWLFEENIRAKGGAYLNICY